MRHDRARLNLHRTVVWVFGHIVHHDTRQVGRGAVLAGLENQGRATAPARRALAEATGTLALDGADGGVVHDHVDIGIRVVVEFGQGVSQILGVNQLVGCVLETLLPVVRWRGRGRDEEELAGVGEGEMQIFVCVDGGGLAKVGAAAFAHDGLAVPDGAHSDGIVVGVEGDEDTAEGFERGPGVDGSGLADQLLDGLQVVGAKDGEVVEVGDQEGVGGWGWLLQRWDAGEIETEGFL